MGKHDAARGPGPESPGAGQRREIRSIDDMKGLHSQELIALFAAGRAPQEARFRDRMRGIVLTAPHHDDTWFGRFLRWFMATFGPWKGKRSVRQPDAEAPGKGNNSILGLWIFNFHWEVTASRLPEEFNPGGAGAIRLDYGSTHDPLNFITTIRCIHDEIREVGAEGSGALLGMATLIHRGRLSSFFYNTLLRLARRKERVRPSGEPVPAVFFALQASPVVAGGEAGSTK